MHVLAHVRASAPLPSSLYDAGYVAFAAAHLGPASERTLAEDADALGRLVTTHAALAHLQLYAALFDEPEDDATRALDPTTTRRPALWPLLREVGPALEILRCAVALERPLLSRLPAVDVDEAALAAAIEEVIPAAPSLGGHELLVLRALRHRGRLFGREIWVGEPAGDVTVTHVAWQAAHEATVGEIARRHPSLSERAVEAEALATLERRARANHLGAHHARWRDRTGG